MEEKKLKELLKQAFNKGRDYQYDINPYSGKLKENSKALTFTKWYNQVKNINVIQCYTDLPCDSCKGTGTTNFTYCPDYFGMGYK
ncbi:hypothetical protein [Seonamhaeicola sp.]|uniref:hypothetical protein n=1 Tax=Seonamhaeicola sp. TaxID=1912245 RepID=UPI00356ACCEE